MNGREIFIESIGTIKNSILYSIAFSVFLPLIMWIWKPDYKIPLSIFMSFFAIVCLLMVISISTINVLWQKYRLEYKRKNSIPRIVDVLTNRGLILILNKSTLFTHRIYVSVFLNNNNGTENYIGIGIVSNIQENGLIQVQIIDWEDGYEREIREIEEKSDIILSKIIVRPYIHEERIQFLLGGRLDE